MRLKFAKAYEKLLIPLKTELYAESSQPILQLLHKYFYYIFLCSALKVCPWECVLVVSTVLSTSTCFLSRLMWKHGLMVELCKQFILCSAIAWVKQENLYLAELTQCET